MIGGAGPTAQIQYRSPLAGPERPAQTSHSGSINPHTDEAAVNGGNSSPSVRVQPAGASEKSGEKPGDHSKATKADGQPLSEEEERQVQKLKETDAKVKAHEQAHAAAGGPHAGAPKFEYTTGPDGKRYATSGEVQIDSSPEDGDPEATIRKMDIVIRAALAPGDPSPQDLSVARQAQSDRAKAQIELSRQREAERSENKGEDDSAGNVQEDNVQEKNLSTSTGDPSSRLDPRLRDAITAYQQGAETNRADRLFQIIAQQESQLSISA